VNILLFYPEVIPVFSSGGTARVVWDLGTELTHMGHRVWWLTHKDSKIILGTHIPYDPEESLNDQIPADIDIIHFHSPLPTSPKVPYVVTVHGNEQYGQVLDTNSIFVSKNHATRHGSDSFVYNGLNWENYPKPELDSTRSRFHFLGEASCRLKNVT